MTPAEMMAEGFGGLLLLLLLLGCESSQLQKKGTLSRRCVRSARLLENQLRGEERGISEKGRNYLTKLQVCSS